MISEPETPTDSVRRIYCEKHTSGEITDYRLAQVKSCIKTKSLPPASPESRIVIFGVAARQSRGDRWTERTRYLSD